jgi:hypothetical protein
MADTKTKHGGSKKVGRNKTKCDAYRSAKRREHNKSKRVLRSSGVAAYLTYCDLHGLKKGLI